MCITTIILLGNNAQMYVIMFVIGKFKTNLEKEIIAIFKGDITPWV